jgi:hypothetical protein
MEKLNEVQQSQLVPVMSIGRKLKSIGHSGVTHIVRNLRANGYTLHKVRGKTGHLVYAITKEDAEKYLATYNQVIASEENKVTTETPGRVEEQVRQRRESDGWISFRLSSAGMPDLLNLRQRSDGLFEVLFEEVKGPGDALRKEQHAVLEDMKQKGIPSVVTWF